MEETKEKKMATAVELAEMVRELLRENVVGLVGDTEGEGVSFSLAGGQKFYLSVKAE